MTTSRAAGAGLVPSDLGYDPWSPAFVADPYPALASAKLEFDVLFERMLRRLPRLELLEEPRWKPRFVLRGLEALRVRA